MGPDTDIAHAHNEFLQAALDLGIPGLVGFLALYIRAFLMLWDIWRATQGQSEIYGSNMRFAIKALVLGFGSGLFGHIVYGMTDAVTLGSRPGVLFWMQLVLISGLYLQMRSGEIVRWQVWFGSQLGKQPLEPITG